MVLTSLTREQLRRLITEPGNAHVRPVLERRLAELEDSGQPLKHPGGGSGESKSASAVAEKPECAAAHTTGVMTKTEERFLHDLIKPRLAAGESVRFEHERIKLRLADATRYTADFFEWLADGRVWVHEVKAGHIWEDSALKFKVAAERYPWWRWTKTQLKGGAWRVLRDYDPYSRGERWEAATLVRSTDTWGRNASGCHSVRRRQGISLLPVIIIQSGEPFDRDHFHQTLRHRALQVLLKAVPACHAEGDLQRHTLGFANMVEDQYGLPAVFRAQRAASHCTSPENLRGGIRWRSTGATRAHPSEGKCSRKVVRNSWPIRVL